VFIPWSMRSCSIAGFNLRQGSAPRILSHQDPGKSSSRLGALTSLTHLELDGCVVPDDLICLSSLRDLQHLTVSVMTHDPTGKGTHGDYSIIIHLQLQ
jgi:hypothetical protein